MDLSRRTMPGSRLSQVFLLLGPSQHPRVEWLACGAFLADFRAFRELGRALTGARYRRGVTQPVLCAADGVAVALGVFEMEIVREVRRDLLTAQWPPLPLLKMACPGFTIAQPGDPLPFETALIAPACSLSGEELARVTAASDWLRRGGRA